VVTFLFPALLAVPASLTLDRAVANTLDLVVNSVSGYQLELKM